MKGYKVFNPDWTCSNFQYEVGKTYTMEEKPKCCCRGFHFCERLASCFCYYEFDPNNKVAEIEATGDIDTNDFDKSCTNIITIVRELTWAEVLTTVNMGKINIGIGNTGDFNSGNFNSGNWNFGDQNSGGANLGSCNSGLYNTGVRNTGMYNSGRFNSGFWNSGYWNSGVFNSKMYHNMDMFNKPSTWSMFDWINSRAHDIMDRAPITQIEWINYEHMNEEEKEENPDAKSTNGYFKYVSCKEKRQQWWDDLPQDDKDEILNLPNFDAEVFKECTGIRVV